MQRKNITTFVMDDGSGDGTEEHVADLPFIYPLAKMDVHLYQFTLNAHRRRMELIYFAKAMDFIIFLDSDVLFLDDSWLDRLLAPFGDSPQIGITGAHGWFVRPDWWKDEAPLDLTGAVDCVSGYCMAVRSPVFNLPDFMDIRYDKGGYCGSGDDNACAVAIQAGYEVWQVASLPIQHTYAGTTNKGVGAFEKNRVLYRSIWENQRVVKFERELP